MVSNLKSFRPHLISIVVGFIVAGTLVWIQFAPVVGGSVDWLTMKARKDYSNVRFGWPFSHHWAMTFTDEAESASLFDKESASLFDKESLFDKQSRPTQNGIKLDVTACAILVGTCMIAAERWARRRTKHSFTLGTLLWIVTSVGITLGLLQLEGALVGDGHLRGFWNAVMRLPLDDQQLTIWGRYSWRQAAPLILILGVSLHTIGWVTVWGIRRFLQLVLPRLFPTSARPDIGLVELTRK